MNWLQRVLFRIGNNLIYRGAYNVRFRVPLQWLGRFFIRHSRVRWEHICEPVDDEADAALYEQLARSFNGDVGSVKRPTAATGGTP